MKTIILVLLAGVLYFSGLGMTALWDPDEPRQAIMAREMMERGDYIRPYLNGEPYREKPPFHPWRIVLSSKILGGGVSEVSARLPSACMALLLVLVTFFLGRAIMDGTAGFLSALIVVTNLQVLSSARESVMDMTFAALITLTIALGYLAVVKGRRWALVGALLPASLAVLTKGPAGLFIPGAVLFILLVTRRALKPYLLPLAAGGVLAVAVASLWFFAAGEDYFLEFIVRQNLLRYTKAFDHRETVFYYFPKIFFNFLPWSLFLPFAIYFSWKKKIWLPVVWFVVTFLFFTASSSKRAVYLLPLYPAAALMCGIYLREKGRSLIEYRWSVPFMTAGAAILFLSTLICAVAMTFVPSVHPVTALFTDIMPAVLVCLWILAFLSLAVILFVVVRKSPSRAMTCMVLYLAVAGVFYTMLYMPVMDRNGKSPLVMARALRETGGKGMLYSYGFTSPGFIYYSERPIRLITHFGKIPGDGGGILIVNEDDFPPKYRGELESLFVPGRTVVYEKETYRIYVRKDG